MFVFILQAILLLAIAFILGSIVGCLLRTQFSAPPRQVRAPEKSAKPAPAVKKPAAPETAAKPAPAAETATAPAGSDDLKQIKGIGRQIEAKLNGAGITRYEQIAGWTKKDIAEFGEKLSFSGRIEREDWVGQAKKLAGGETP